VLDTLAAAYAEEGQFTRASTTAARALVLAKAQGNQALRTDIRDRLLLYAKNKPFHGGRAASSLHRGKVNLPIPRESQ